MACMPYGWCKQQACSHHADQPVKQVSQSNELYCSSHVYLQGMSFVFALHVICICRALPGRLGPQFAASEIVHVRHIYRQLEAAYIN